MRKVLYAILLLIVLAIPLTLSVFARSSYSIMQTTQKAVIYESASTAAASISSYNVEKRFIPIGETKSFWKVAIRDPKTKTTNSGYVLKEHCTVYISPSKKIIAELEESGKSVVDNRKVYQGVSNRTINLDSQIGTLDEFEIDIDLAFRIGCDVLDSIYPSYGLDNDYAPYIREVEEQGLYVVSYAPNDMDTYGGDICVAISKKNGEILRIWGGE